ncbi:hypothetical protein SRB5_57840 [Streptomyces sp. RB5]|uniref:Uncharacterized protein n=1 Tax=Streptomyces smaragdinus TaxID=2585196 RepID=A0A7K0CQ41_9ACTN|nr:hypothetical protein [Streptomyces smaragdinus]MQY15598.1 hypothetical protein [Streptomyces smaragdinus]
MSYNQPPPGPYGQQPGPYGGQPQQGGYGTPQPQQPGYGYPAQPPQGGPQDSAYQPTQIAPAAQPPVAPPGPPPSPYGQQQPPQPPQQPYGQPQQPYGQPQYGQQPPGMPPQMPGPATPGGGGGNKTGIIVAAAVAAVALIAGGVFFFAGSDDEGGGKGDDKQTTANGGGKGKDPVDTKKYKLTSPDTVAEVWNKDTTKSEDSALDSDELSNLEDLGVSADDNVSGSYKDSAESTAKILQFAGVYGTVSDPEAAVDGAFDKLIEDSKSSNTSTEKAEPVGEPEAFTPDGLEEGAVMKCLSVRFTTSSGGKDLSFDFPTCVWADSSTVGYVAISDPASVLTGKGMEPSQCAEITAKVRKDTRVAL